MSFRYQYVWTLYRSLVHNTINILTQKNCILSTSTLPSLPPSPQMFFFQSSWGAKGFKGLQCTNIHYHYLYSFFFYKGTCYSVIIIIIMNDSVLLCFHVCPPPSSHTHLQSLFFSCFMFVLKMLLEGCVCECDAVVWFCIWKTINILHIKIRKCESKWFIFCVYLCLCSCISVSLSLCQSVYMLCVTLTSLV